MRRYLFEKHFGSILNVTVIIFALLLSPSCHNRKGGEQAETDVAEQYHTIDSEILFDAHKEAMRKEKIQINDFIERYNWDMLESPTGLRYMIYKHGNGRQVEKNDIVVLDYTVKFLNGQLVYSSENDGMKIFQLSHSDETSGLEEGILMLHVGDKARFIVPSYLAYGVTGDLKKISTNNTLVYEIQLTDIK